jgi:hypothetical protein
VLHPSLCVATLAIGLGCAPLRPVPRYPWVEDRERELSAEKLLLEVQGDEVAVDARFEFRGEHGDQTMGFPVPRLGGAPRSFEAIVAQESGVTTTLPSSLGVPTMLPVPLEDFVSYDIFVPKGALDHGAMHVRYRQLGRPRFDYVLATGAYWRGPIRHLLVEVIDRGHRVRSALVEGLPPERFDAAREVMRWDLRDIEPRSGATLELK